MLLYLGVGTRRGRGYCSICGFDSRGVVRGVGAGCWEFLGGDRGAGILGVGVLVYGGGCLRPGVQATLSLCVVQCAVWLL